MRNGVTGLLLPYLRRRRRRYLLGAALAIAGAGAELGVPLVLGRLVDLAGRGVEGDRSVAAATLLAALLVARGAASFLARFVLDEESVRAQTALQISVVDGLRHVTPRRGLEPGAGAYQSAVADARGASFLFGPAWAFGTHLTSNVVFGGLALFAIAPRAALPIAALLPVLAWRLSSSASAESAAYHEFQRGLEKLTDHVATSVRGLTELKLLASPVLWRRESARIGAVYASASWKMHAKRLATERLTLTFAVSLSSIGLCLLAREAWTGRASLGSLFAFLTYLTLAVGAVGQLGGFWAGVRRARVSLDRLAAEAGGRAPARTGPPELPAKRQAVFRVRNYPLREAGTLALDLAPGDTLAVTGPVGSGKTTLLRALCGLEGGYEGTIHFQGRDTRSLRREALDHGVVYLPQQPAFFSGTLRENVALGASVSDAAIRNALTAVELDGELGDGAHVLDLVLSERGLRLSTGQRQRLALARALVRDAEACLLDDSLSGVDPDRGREILGRVLARFSDRVVVVAGRNEWFLSPCARRVSLGAEAPGGSA